MPKQRPSADNRPAVLRGRPRHRCSLRGYAPDDRPHRTTRHDYAASWTSARWRNLRFLFWFS